MGWSTAMACVRRHGEPLVEDPGRITTTEALGIDEHKELSATKDRHTLGATSFVDIATGPGRVNRDWQHEVPLVLIATDYLPFTDREAPTGNVLWLDPSTEVTYMRSLARVGVLEFRVHGE